MFGGKIMDNFMDKIAQRISSQEVIRANAQAEALQMKKLQAQFETYDELLKEMQQLNQKNTALADMAKSLMESCQERLEQEPQENEAENEAIEAQEKLLEEVRLSVEELKQALAGNAAKTEELLEQSQEFVHKENVKVYRNVQAVIVEELKNQTQELNAGTQKLEKQTAGLKPIMVIALVLGAVNAGMLAAVLLNLCGVLSF